MRSQKKRHARAHKSAYQTNSCRVGTFQTNGFSRWLICNRPTRTTKRVSHSVTQEITTQVGALKYLSPAQSFFKFLLFKVFHLVSNSTTSSGLNSWRKHIHQSGQTFCLRVRTMSYLKPRRRRDSCTIDFIYGFSSTHLQASN